jgi:hypothetical protein
MNSAASMVFPAPALPQTRVGLPAGKPPNVISSKPWIPVLTLAIVFAALAPEVLAVMFL